MFAIFEKRYSKPESPPPEIIDVLDSPQTEVIDITSDEPSSPLLESSPQVPTFKLTPIEGSQDDPIVVESSPAKLASSSPTIVKPVWSIFQRKSVPQPSSSLKGKQRATDGAFAPFPGGDSQHIRGLQSRFENPPSPFLRREPCIPPISSENVLSNTLHDFFSRDRLSRSIPPQIPTSEALCNDDDYVGTIPRSHSSIPAVSRSLQRARERATSIIPDSHQEAWTEKWRPRCAQEVVGNEERALYLRDWMLALRLQMGTGVEEVKAGPKNRKKRKHAKGKKPAVIRHVKKRRKMDDGLADFLASDDDDSHEYSSFGADEDDFAFCERMQNTLGLSNATTPEASSQASSALSDLDDCDVAEADKLLAFPYVPTNFGLQIHNTILLAGPSGCGKTAAVYACAEELGWEVFEVYPGVGERNGPELHKMIGDIGKNHIVHSALQHSPIRRHSYFSRPSRGTKKTVIHVDSEEDEGAVSAKQDHADTYGSSDPPVEPAIKQSVVLIEEVDILYGSDAGFWPAIINIIKECRRPVVLTCNGMCFRYPSRV